MGEPDRSSLRPMAGGEGRGMRGGALFSEELAAGWGGGRSGGGGRLDGSGPNISCASELEATLVVLVDGDCRPLFFKDSVEVSEAESSACCSSDLWASALEYVAVPAADEKVRIFAPPGTVACGRISFGASERLERSGS